MRIDGEFDQIIWSKIFQSTRSLRIGISGPHCLVPSRLSLIKSFGRRFSNQQDLFEWEQWIKLHGSQLPCDLANQVEWHHDEDAEGVKTMGHPSQDPSGTPSPFPPQNKPKLPLPVLPPSAKIHKGEDLINSWLVQRVRPAAQNHGGSNKMLWSACTPPTVALHA